MAARKQAMSNGMPAKIRRVYGKAWRITIKRMAKAPGYLEGQTRSPLFRPRIMIHEPLVQYHNVLDNSRTALSRPFIGCIITSDCEIWSVSALYLR